MIIEVCERLMDNAWETIDDGNGHAISVKAPKYHAQIQGEPGLWGCGRTHDEAVGSLIRSHPEKFGISITIMGKLAR